MAGLLTSLWQSWQRFSRQNSPRRRRPAPRTRLSLEHLEDRTVPSATLGWGTTVGDTVPSASSVGKAVATDAAGNVYMTGSFSGDFVSPSGTLTSAGGTDIFVTKYSRDGVFQWAVSMGGTQNDSGNGIAVDSGGNNVYLVGQNNGVDYVANLNGTTGALTWAQSGANSSAVAVAVDASSYAYVTSHGLNASYVTKFDSGGNQLWQDKFTDNSAVMASGGQAWPLSTSSIAVSGSTVYLGGTFNSTATFSTASGNTTLTVQSASAFVVALTSNNQMLWAKDFQGVKSKGSVGIPWTCYVTADPTGNVYATGNFQGYVNFANSNKATGPFVLNGTIQGDEGAVYVTKLDHNGNVVWARSLAIPSTSGYADVCQISVDGAGAVYLTGVYGGTISFNPSGGSAMSSVGGSNDIFVAKLDTNGAFQWSASAGGTAEDRGTAICVDAYGDVYLAGGMNLSTGSSQPPPLANYSVDLDPMHSYSDNHDILETSTATALLWQLKPS